MRIAMGVCFSLWACGVPGDGTKSVDTASEGTFGSALDGCQSMAKWMTLCGDDTVDTNAVIEECSLEADRIAQTCDSEVSQAYLSGLQQAYDCLLDLE